MGTLQGKETREVLGQLPACRLRPMMLLTVAIPTLALLPLPSRAPVHAVLLRRAARPAMSLDERRSELPPKPLLAAVERRAGGRVSAADIAAAAGLDLQETRRALLVLARLVGADLQVASDGELFFVFGEDVKRRLRRASLRARAGEAWDTASVPLFWLLRASFGVALLSSLTIAVTAIAALMASSSKSDSDSGRGGSSLTMLPYNMWGPHPLDIFYYSRRARPRESAAPRPERRSLPTRPPRLRSRLPQVPPDARGRARLPAVVLLAPLRRRRPERRLPPPLPRRRRRAHPRRGRRSDGAEQPAPPPARHGGGAHSMRRVLRRSNSRRYSRRPSSRPTRARSAAAGVTRVCALRKAFFKPPRARVP